MDGRLPISFEVGIALGRWTDVFIGLAVLAVVVGSTRVGTAIAEMGKVVGPSDDAGGEVGSCRSMVENVAYQLGAALGVPVGNRLGVWVVRNPSIPVIVGRRDNGSGTVEGGADQTVADDDGVRDGRDV